MTMKLLSLLALLLVVTTAVVAANPDNNVIQSVELGHVDNEAMILADLERGANEDTERQQVTNDAPLVYYDSLIELGATCPAGKTCCKNKHDQLSVCMYEGGVCCPGVEWCCPQHHTCNLSPTAEWNKRCVLDTSQQSPEVKPHASETRLGEPGTKHAVPEGGHRDDGATVKSKETDAADHHDNNGNESPQSPQHRIEQPNPHELCYTDDQHDYRGTVNVTRRGKPCMNWGGDLRRKTKRKMKATPDKYPHAGLVRNYCRNPDGSPKAWCYTETSWGLCDVPCGAPNSPDAKKPKIRHQHKPSTGKTLDVFGVKHEVEAHHEHAARQQAHAVKKQQSTCLCKREDQSDYRGKLAITVSGRTCQAWSDDFPHKHDHKTHAYAGEGLEANYCRNPAGERERAWCYTTDANVTWEYCYVPCPHHEKPAECCRQPDQFDYRGTVSTTINGRTCQRWDAQVPHEHKRDPANFPLSGLDNNYCRNPDGNKRAWCYTTDPLKKWEYCNVKCNPAACCDEPNQSDYRGTVSVAESGIACQQWDRQSPHKHTYTPHNYPHDGLAGHNHCRNPGGERERAWCFLATNVTGREWDYCKVDCAVRQPCISDAPAHTLPSESHLPVTIAFASCMNFNPAWNHGGPDPTFWNSVISESRPDMFVWMGDNIYADTEDNGPGCSQMNRRYVRLKNDAGYRTFLEAKIPVMATYDDHDFGMNQANKYYKRKDASQTRHLDFFDEPQDSWRRQQKGIYYSKTFAEYGKRVKVIMLDVRYFRSATYPVYGECEGHSSSTLGEEQWRWLEHEMLEAVNPASGGKPIDVLIITSAIQVLPPTRENPEANRMCAFNDTGSARMAHAAIEELEETTSFGWDTEGWSEFPVERLRLLRLCQRAKLSGQFHRIVFISGDVHSGEISRKVVPARPGAPPASFEHKPVELWEMTASGIRNRYIDDAKNPNRLSIAADLHGNGKFEHECVFPFRIGKAVFKNCTMAGRSKAQKKAGQYWCSLQTDDKGHHVKGRWGLCAPEGAKVPWGTQGRVANTHVFSHHPYRINSATSNYGLFRIDFANNRLSMHIVTPEQGQRIAAEAHIPIYEQQH